MTVEASPQSKGALAALFRMIAQKPGLVFVRLDKAGVGDSEGDCSNSEFDSELDGYRAGFRTLGRYDFVDPAKVFIHLCHRQQEHTRSSAIC